MRHKADIYGTFTYVVLYCRGTLTLIQLGKCVVLIIVPVIPVKCVICGLRKPKTEGKDTVINLREILKE